MRLSFPPAPSCPRRSLARGGALLNALSRGAADAGGDDAARALALFLLERGAAPLLRGLEAWIFDGRLDDRHGEFFVRDRNMLAALGGARARGSGGRSGSGSGSRSRSAGEGGGLDDDNDDDDDAGAAGEG